MDPTLFVEVARERFVDVLRGGGPRVRKVNSKWCMAMFVGAQSTEREPSGFRSSLSRSLAWVQFHLVSVLVSVVRFNAVGFVGGSFIGLLFRQNEHATNLDSMFGGPAQRQFVLKS